MPATRMIALMVVCAIVTCVAGAPGPVPSGAASAGAATAGGISSAAAGVFEAPIHGIILSTHGGGRDWGGDGMPPALDRIHALGGNWVAIHPYAAIGGDGAVRFAPIDPASPPAHLARPIAEAHARGMRILIIPHLAYWGSPFRWRGEIGFEDRAAWERFWRDYRAWIVSLARATREADGFVVGNEMVRTHAYETEWRALIHEVRGATPVALTYAANWDEFEEVPFWDALDAIGIQAYFPLTEESDTSEPAIRAGWARWMARLRAFSTAKGRPLLFTELGYNQAFDAPVRPWESHTDGATARVVQERCLRVALEVVGREPCIRGVFLWKWFPEPQPAGRNFQLAVPEIERVIANAWRPGASKAPAHVR